MVGSKHAPEAKCEPSGKRTAADLEMKVRMICKYEGDQSLSAAACELGFLLSTVTSLSFI
jgi:hypothetical protein